MFCIHVNQRTINTVEVTNIRTISKGWHIQNSTGAMGYISKICSFIFQWEELVYQ